MDKLVIPGQLLGLNEIIDLSKKGKGSYQPYAIAKKDYTEQIAWLAKSQIKNKYKKINVEIEWICKNKRRDKDNIIAGTKFILDGLVLAGVIENDGWKQIGDINHKFDVDRDNPRIVVKIEEAE